MFKSLSVEWTSDIDLFEVRDMRGKSAGAEQLWSWMVGCYIIGAELSCDPGHAELQHLLSSADLDLGVESIDDAWLGDHRDNFVVDRVEVQ